MISINAAVIDLKRLELLADSDTPIHALDARAKVLVTLVFIVSVVSCGRYELARLMPFCIFPAVMIAVANLPALFLALEPNFSTASLIALIGFMLMFIGGLTFCNSIFLIIFHSEQKGKFMGDMWRIGCFNG